MSRKEPHATLISRGPAHRVWFVQWPGLPWTISRAFYVTDFPGSDFLSVEPASRRRKTSEKLYSRMVAGMRRAIESADLGGPDDQPAV
ncbi:hypothetical protein [Rhizobium phage RHph_X2_26]|nr:hypothetical protein [Rhizobium phage RHph_X2_26]